MPGLSGDQVAVQIKALIPDMLVIMVTGFGGIMTAIGERPPGIDHVLNKPVTLQELRAVFARYCPSPRS